MWSRPPVLQPKKTLEWTPQIDDVTNIKLSNSDLLHSFPLRASPPPLRPSFGRCNWRCGQKRYMLRRFVATVLPYPVCACARVCGGYRAIWNRLVAKTRFSQSRRIFDGFKNNVASFFWFIPCSQAHFGLPRRTS